MSIPFNRVFKHLLFWLAFWLIYIYLAYSDRTGFQVVAVIYFWKILVQAFAAYVLVYLIIPRFLNRKKYLLFTVICFTWTYITYMLLTASRVGYLEPSYTWFFRESSKHALYLDQDFAARCLNIRLFLDSIPWLFLPAAVMGLIRFYTDQLRLVRIEEEKKSMELKLLREQLNPHFLFNTLNNLYALALKKDERTADSVARLTGILDHMLHKGNERYTDILQEMSLIGHYVALEKLRYGDRFTFTLVQQIDEPVKVPPLLFTSCLENAFKHGVKNDIRASYIYMEVRTVKGKIHFRIENSKPAYTHQSPPPKDQLGMENIRNQLNILYPHKHVLSVEQSPEKFSLSLVLENA